MNEGEEEEICLCPDDGCEDEQKFCSTKTDKNGLEVELCLCPEEECS